MIRRLTLASLIAFFPAIASAQFATIGPTPPTTDNGDRLATTAWVNQFIALGLPLASGQIYIGSTGGIATAQTPSGDLTVSNAGVFTLATVNANTGAFGSATSCVTVTNNAKGLTTAVSAQTCTPALGSITGFGTGVQAALAINVGTAGSPVINGGALGTPSSGVATNLTGTAAGLTSGHVTTNANLTGDTTSVGNVTTTTKINGVDQTTAWTTFTPALSCGTATFTVNSARFKTMGKTTFLSIDFSIASVGTCTTVFSFTLPTTPQSGTGFGSREAAINGKGIGVTLSAGSATANGTKMDLSQIVINERYQFGGVYESQ